MGDGNNFMKRVLPVLLLTSLIACAHQHQSPEEKIAEQCAAAGYKDQEYNDCLEIAYRAFAESLLQRQENRIKTEELLKRNRLAADKDKCKEYGFKKGSKDFAACMMQIEQARTQQLEQEKATAAQLISNQRIAEMQMRQNYALQQQVVREQQQQRQQQLNNNIIQVQKPRLSTHCTSSMVGNYMYTDCN